MVGEGRLVVSLGLRLSASPKRHLPFALCLLLSAPIFYSPIEQLVDLSFHNGLYSHILLMPVLGGYFLYSKRKSIFSHSEYSLGPGVALIGIGAMLSAGCMRVFSLGRNDHLSLLTFSALLVWVGIFTVFYGFRTLGRAAFPVLFLFLMIPLPGFLTEALVGVLRKASVESVCGLFYVVGFPASRDGYVFHFPQLSIQVTEECSGIRSFVAVAITSIVAGNLILRKGWTRLLVVIAVVPIAILKNALRIVVISFIAVYMGEGAFLSAFHGLVGFTIFAFFLLGLLIALLKRLEARLPHDETAMKEKVASP